MQGFWNGPYLRTGRVRGPRPRGRYQHPRRCHPETITLSVSHIHRHSLSLSIYLSIYLSHTHTHTHTLSIYLLISFFLSVCTLSFFLYLSISLYIYLELRKNSNGGKYPPWRRFYCVADDGNRENGMYVCIHNTKDKMEGLQQDWGLEISTGGIISQNKGEWMGAQDGWV